MSDYVITRVVPTTYIDNKTNEAVSGHRVYYTMTDYEEGHLIDVPNMKKDTVKDAIENAVDARDALAELGS